MKYLIAHIRNKKGFTVIEAFVGISILLIGIVGPLTLVNTNLQGARFSRDQVTAVYLAQEGIETVRQIRDNNFLQDNKWLSGLRACMGTCIVDGIDGSVSNGRGSCKAEDPENVNESFRLQVDRSNGTYFHGSGDDSRFWRCVRIKAGRGGAKHVRVIATVIFDTGRYYQAYETVGYMSNWNPN